MCMRVHIIIQHILVGCIRLIKKIASRDPCHALDRLFLYMIIDQLVLLPLIATVFKRKKKILRIKYYNTENRMLDII